MKTVAARAIRSKRTSRQTGRCASGPAIENQGGRPVPAFAKLARSSLLILILASASGCANWPDDKYKPQIPQAAKLPFVDQAFATMMAEGKGKHGVKAYPRPVRLNDYKDSLRALLVTVMASAETSNDQFWDVSMTTLVGGVAGTIGALSGQVGLTNTGLAVAGAGQIQKTYYNPEQVRNHHLSAHTKLACISTEISTLSTIQRQLAMRSSAEGAREAAFALDYIAHSVDAVLVNYRKVLLGMAPQVSTREDILRFVVDYQAQTAKAQAATKAAGGAAPDIDREVDDDDAPENNTPAGIQPTPGPAAANAAADMPASITVTVAPQASPAASAAVPAAVAPAAPASAATAQTTTVVVTPQALPATSAAVPAAVAPATPASAAAPAQTITIVLTPRVLPAVSAAAPAAAASAPRASAAAVERSLAEKANADRYAARFVDLKVRLEACTKGLVS